MKSAVGDVSVRMSLPIREREGGRFLISILGVYNCGSIPFNKYSRKFSRLGVNCSLLLSSRYLLITVCIKSGGQQA
jgi:hypothetical protein